MVDREGAVLEPILVVFGCDLNYAPHLAAALMSILANGGGDSFVFTILQQDFDPGTRDKLAAMIAPYRNARLAWPDLAIPRAAEYAQSGYLTLAAYFRIFIPDLLPAAAKRAIYLDSDLIVTGSLRALWTADLGGRALGAVRDPVRIQRDLEDRYVKLGLPPHAHYFNSGVLLLDLEKWRAQGISARVAQFAIDHPEKLSWADQDALNFVLHDDYQALPMEWNLQRRMCHMLPRELGLSVPDYLRLRRRPKVVHFTEATKPWSHRDGHPFAHLYFRYLAMTPFAAQVARTRRFDFGSTFGRWLRRLKNEAKVLRPVLWWRARTNRTPPPSLAALKLASDDGAR
jgi:lipopolysaccharide biosynthesis glycosyltransferase